ncbi:hypothetical protein Lepto7376_2257 [[Leptolyngbya] sp. PCC 7376]|nr:hypothetical protein Lepto7376_2257 [[Leptolyngbya] sp. PCC 7376]
MRIDIAGKPNGTGFFVGQGLVLTCNHVVKDRAIATLSLCWGERSFSVTKIRIPNPEIDLALLHLSEEFDHDWVIFCDEIAEREKLKTFGYPDGYAQGDPATFEYEGMTGDRQLIKFKLGQVQKGFSGSPLVNERTNQVCGVIKKTRDRRSDLGGRAIPVGVVWDIFPELKPEVVEIPANPFKPLNGVIDSPDLFFGRERELRSVFEILNSGSSVAVIGDRQVGKSSFLKAIAHHAERQLIKYRRPVYLNFQDIYDDEDFYYALCSEIDIETCRGYRLRRTISKLDPPILLLLDEVEKMKWEGFTLQIRSQLRGLAEGSDAPLRLVVAASMDLDSLFPDSAGNVSPFKNVCLNESPPFWDEAAVKMFIQLRLAATPIRFSDQEIMRILLDTQGHPQKVMLACFRLYNRYKSEF